MLALALAALVPCAGFADTVLRGNVVDAETGKPVAFVNVILDEERTFITTREGMFNFGEVSDGPHALVFSHISYRGRRVEIRLPSQSMPMRVELVPSQFTAEKIVVRAERTVSSLPVGAVSVDRDAITETPGNIANDPLRTLQSQPSCAVDGVDFLSKMAVRGGDAEEHRVYFDGYPLPHYAHAGGFAGVIYDDMLESTTLVPGAAPLRYNGCLSGVVTMNPIKPDTSFRSFRYDITSMAGGASEILSPSVSAQASAKTSFFNLPAYQEVGVKSRSFRDVLGRFVYSPGPSLTTTTTVLFATDAEKGNALFESRARDVQSLLAGVDLTYRKSVWRFALRPSFTNYDAHDELTYPQGERNHKLSESRVQAIVAREGHAVGLTLAGEGGAIRHVGSGGDRDDNHFAASAEGRLTVGEIAALVAGGGASREPWTRGAEGEAYASARVNAGEWASVSAGYRRSHQSPFLFSEKRYFASFAIDPGDLIEAYAPGAGEAPAVRMDQLSAEATVTLPYKWSVTGNVFQRDYDNLLTWDWSGFPSVADVRSEGEGHGEGYEFGIARTDPELISVTASMSRARVWKREGSLPSERPGDFDRPRSWQAGVSIRLTERVRLAMRWLDVDGRPYTPYYQQSDAPAPADVNATRLERYQRLDAKIVYSILNESFDGFVFVDFINLTNRRNVATRYAVEGAPGTYSTAPYGGTRFFPIAGVTVHF